MNQISKRLKKRIRVVPTQEGLGIQPKPFATLITLPVTLTEAIPTGAKRELSIELVVPTGINGVIESAWQMADENGIFFGDTLFVKIITGDVTTPAVTNTP